MWISRAPRDPTPGSQSALGALLAGIVLLMGSPLQAESPTREKIHIDYSATAACPDARTFEGLVLELSNKIEITTKPNAKRRFTVTVETPAPDRAVGRLELADGSAHSSRRDFRGASCGEVTEALALALALLVDPDLLDDPSKPGEPSRPADVDLDESPPDETPDEPDEPPETVDEPPLREPWFGLQAALGGAFAGDAPRVEAGLGVTLWGGAALTHSSLHLEAFVGRALDDGSGLLLAWLPNARLSICPAGLALTESLTLAPCVGGELGALRSSAGEALAPLPEATRPWGAGLLELRLRWRSAPLLFEMRGGVLLPLVKQSYWAASNDGDTLLLAIGQDPQVSFTLAAYFELL